MDEFASDAEVTFRSDLKGKNQKKRDDVLGIYLVKIAISVDCFVFSGLFSYTSPVLMIHDCTILACTFHICGVDPSKEGPQFTL